MQKQNEKRDGNRCNLHRSPLPPRPPGSASLAAADERNGGRRQSEIRSLSSLARVRVYYYISPGYRPSRFSDRFVESGGFEFRSVLRNPRRRHPRAWARATQSSSGPLPLSRRRPRPILATSGHLKPDTRLSRTNRRREEIGGEISSSPVSLLLLPPSPVILLPSVVLCPHRLVPCRRLSTLSILLQTVGDSYESRKCKRKDYFFVDFLKLNLLSHESTFRPTNGHRKKKSNRSVEFHVVNEMFSE